MVLLTSVVASLVLVASPLVALGVVASVVVGVVASVVVALGVFSESIRQG